MLVIGSRNSSNSNRLVEVAREHGADSYLIDNELAGARGVARRQAGRRDHVGRQRPEELVQRLVDFFRSRGTSDVQELEVVQEDVRFMLPKAIRQAMASASAACEPGAAALRTLVVSDLHLGSHTKGDVLRNADWRLALLGALDGVDRLVLLGDIVELRHGPVREALEAARGVLEAVGGALPAGAEVVIVPGNHDHHLLSGWFERRGADRAPGGSASPPRSTGARATRWRRSPGFSRRPRSARRTRASGCATDVYATHGHYCDRHTTVPLFERLAAGAMARVVGEPPGRTRERRVTTKRRWRRCTRGSTRSRRTAERASAGDRTGPRRGPGAR